MAPYILDSNTHLYSRHNLLLLGSGLVAVAIIYFGVCIPIYNITLHPLAKARGPKLYAAFHFPFYLDRWSGSLARKTTGMHDVYGDTVRLRPDALSFTTAQAWKDIYGFRQGKGQIPKEMSSYGRKDYEGDIIVSDDVSHSRMRKLLAHAFSERALHEQEPIISGYIDLLIEKLGEKVDGSDKGVVDIKNWYNFTTFDLIGDLAFGEPFGGLTGENLHYWVQTIFDALKGARKTHTFLAYPLLAKFYGLFASTTNKGRDKNLAFARTTADNRLDRNTDRKDFTSYILRYNDEKGMTREEIARNAAILIIAGSETTATLLSGATWYLCQNPEVLETLKHEIHESFADEKEITLASVAQLSYLHAVLEESLRCYPPVPSALWRRTIGDGEIIDGHLVPHGTSVAVTQLAANFSASNFAFPKKFAPERWLEPIPSEYENDKKDAMQPFSTGPRNCIGKNLAYAEMRSILARVVWNFDMKLREESLQWMENQPVYTIWEKPALFVRLSRRQDKV